MTRHPQTSGRHRRTGVGLMILAIVCAALTMMSWMSAAAHHSFSAEFDSAREVRATGTVSGIEWMNPHAWFHLEVQELCERQGVPGGDDDENEWDCRTPRADEARDWGFELASPNGLMRLGWNRNSLRVDDRVTVEGTRARDDSRNANARSVTTADGGRLFAGSSEGSTP